MKKLYLPTAFILISLAFAVGCGGGSGGDDDNQPEQLVIDSLTSSSGEIFAGGEVTVSVTANGGAHGGLSFLWQSDCDGQFEQADQSEATFTASSSASDQTCSLEITVSSATQSASDETQLNILEPVEQQIVLDSISASASQVSSGDSISLSVTANNGDHAGLTFEWTTTCEGQFSQADESETSFTAAEEAVTQSCTIAVTASSTTQSKSTDLEISITTKNIAPEITESYQSSTTTNTSEDLVFRVTATDNLLSSLHFEWQSSAGTLGTPTEIIEETTATSEVILLAPNCHSEPIEVSVTVFDDENESANYQFTALTIPACDISQITPVITVTRTSGEAPFHIFVSASDTTANNIAYPYDEIEYQWDFGAASDDISFVHPVNKNSTSANSNQTGPEAAFVYNTPGTFTITLTAAYGDDSNQTSIEITVGSWSGDTLYFDPVSGDDNNDGTSDSSPKQTWQALSDWVAGGDNRQALIKRGTIMPVDTEIYLSTSNIRFGSYGEGSIPQILAIEDIDYFVRLSPDDVMSGILFSNLEINGNNGNATTLVYATLLDDAEYLSHIAYLNLLLVNDDPHELDGNGTEIIKAKNLIMMQNYNGAGNISDVIVWNTVFERNHGFKNGIYGEIKNHLAVVGCTFSGGDGNSIKDHPIYPANVDHALYRWNDFQATYSNNFSINSAAKSSHTVRFNLFDGNNFTGGSNGIDLTKHTDTAIGWFSEVIIQNNAFHDLGQPAQGYGIMGGSLERISIHDNVFYGNPQTDIVIDADGKDVSLALYANKFWKGGENPNTLPMLDFENTVKLTMSDNVFVNEGVSGGSTLILSFVIPAGNNWEVDNNQYWAPGISAPFKLPGIDYYSFEDWQQTTGYDANSLNQDPGFSDPENGEF